MRRLSFVLFALSLSLASNAYAADPKHLKKLTTLHECVDCDLSGAVLPYIALKNANLSGANLSGAKLKGADLSGATLKGANLSNADLSETDLNGTNLSGADLKGANLYSVNLLRADLTDADLSTTKNVGKVTVGEALLCRTKLESGVESRDCTKKP